MSGKVATGSVLLMHDVGLHARPSVKLTKLAKTFASRIELALAGDGPWIDAKSIVKVMATKAPKNTVLHFRAEGDDAKAAVDALDRAGRRAISRMRRPGSRATWPMPEPVELKGRPAAPGVAAGPLFRFDAEIARRLPTGDAKRERAGARRRGRAGDRADRSADRDDGRREPRHSRIPGGDARRRRADRPCPRRRSRPATAPRPRGSRR